MLLSWIGIKVLDELRISDLVSWCSDVVRKRILAVNFIRILWNILNPNKFIIAVLIYLWLDILFIILIVIDIFILKVLFIFFLLYNLISVIVWHNLLRLQSRDLKLSLLIVISHNWIIIGLGSSVMNSLTWAG